MAREFKHNSLSGVVCESLSDFAAWLAAKPLPGIRYDPSFFPDRDLAISRLMSGDDTRVARSDKLMDAIEAIERLTDAAPVSERAVSGGMADVPAFLSGSPVAMRRRVKRETKAPLTIVVDVMVSGGLSWEVIERRGVAVLALLRKLQADGYPVTLYLLGGGRVGSGREAVIVGMETAPLDLSRTCYAMADAGYCRSIMFTAQTRLAGLSRYPDQNLWSKDEDYPAICAQAGIDPETVIMVPYLTSLNAHKSDKQAAEWVNDAYGAAIAKAAL